jgi:hypothetical protein
MILVRLKNMCLNGMYNSVHIGNNFSGNFVIRYD